LITKTAMRYSPKTAEDYRCGFFDKMKLGTEAWNLAFLALDFDGFPFAAPNTGVSIWRTVCSDRVTGEFLNPHSETFYATKTVAHLLRRPAAEFVDWAENAPVIDKLPITTLMPDWVPRARRRVLLCSEHPDDKILQALDNPIKDLSVALAYLRKFGK